MISGIFSLRTISKTFFSRRIAILIFIFILAAFIYFLIVISGTHEKYDSFQDFSYPSNVNFYKILQLNNTKVIPKLFPYEPEVMNEKNIKKDNLTENNIVIIVKSSIGNLEKRNGIRRSWASKECKTTHQFQVYFALGQVYSPHNADSLIQTKIDLESTDYNDIVQFNFIDNYINNTYKVMAIMDYFVKYESETPYLVIVDDDYFLDPSVLVETIEKEITIEQYPRFLGGYIWYQARPIRNSLSNWYVSYKAYRYNYYPPYPAGGFMLISYPMARTLNKLMPFLKYNSIDDVVIGILMFKLNIYPNHLRNIHMYKPNPIPKNLLACHKLSSNLLNFWEKNQYQKKCIKK